MYLELSSEVIFTLVPTHHPHLHQLQHRHHQLLEPIHHRLDRLLVAIVLADPLVVGELLKQAG